LNSKIHFELGSAPAPGVIRRASRRTFAPSATNLRLFIVVRLADEASAGTREARVLPI
jgi:hypothetical protein